MKTRFYILAVAVIMVAVFSGCEKPEKTWLNEGSVTTDVASDVTLNSAKLQGAVYPLEAEVTEMGFYYDTTREMFSLQKVVATDGFSTVVTGLEANTTYYYYAYATAYGKTKQGDIKMFKTQDSDQYYIDFETGDFSQARFSYSSDYPWEVTTNHPYEGSYCMRSTNLYADNTDSYMDLTINCNKERVVSFYVNFRIYTGSYEHTRNYFTFSIDNEPVSGTIYGSSENYRLLEFTIPQGEHTLRWNHHNAGTDGWAFVDKIEIK